MKEPLVLITTVQKRMLLYRFCFCEGSVSIESFLIQSYEINCVFEPDEYILGSIDFIDKETAIQHNRRCYERTGT